MNLSPTQQYVLLALMALLTIFNFYVFVLGREKRERAKAGFQQTLAALDKEATAFMKQRSLNFDVKQGYINDLGEGVLLTFDTERKQVAIFLKDARYTFGFDEFVSCSLRYDTHSNNKISNITVEIETKDSVIALLFGSKQRKPNSYLGNFILSDSKEFCTLLEQHCTTSNS